MKSGDAQINSIITKAQELGLVCQLTQNNTWTINLKEDYSLFQVETGWILPIQEGLEIHISNSVVYDFLKQWYLYI